MMKKMAFIIISSFFVVAIAFSQTISSQKNSDWTTTPFKEDNGQFLRIRKAIDQSLKKDTDPWSIYISYKRQVNAKKSPTYFGWGYAAFKFASTGVNGAKANQIQDEVLNGFEKKTLPSTYEFMRMRFLITARGTYPQKLKPLAERLLKHTSQDYDVQITYGKILADSPTKEGRKIAAKYAEELARQYPEKRGVYALLGRAYDALWVSKEDSSARSKAVDAYQKYLEITPDTPRNAENRRNAQALLMVAQRGQK